MKNNENIYSFLKESGFELIKEDTSAFFGDYYDVFGIGDRPRLFCRRTIFPENVVCPLFSSGKTIENMHVVPDGKGGYIWWGKDGVVKP